MSTFVNDYVKFVKWDQESMSQTNFSLVITTLQ